MSASAPKFASFRPKSKAPEQPPPEDLRREEKEQGQRKPSREKNRDERNRDERNRDGRNRDERKSPLREKRERARDEPSKKAYFSDRRGDLDIVRYGTLNRYDIPGYRRCGYGNVLGLPDQKIDREYSTETKIYMTPLVRRRQKRMLTDKHAAREGKRVLRLVKAAEDHRNDATRDYIALSSTGKRKRGSGNDSGEDDDVAPAPDYRGIEDKRNPGRADDPDTCYESGTEAAAANSEVTQKNSRLIRETRDDPKNLQAWMNLIEHQEPMMKLDWATTDLSAASRLNLADVRISTYEEALRKVVDDEASQIELHIGLLREVQRHWDDAKAATKWQDALKKHPHSVKLWLGYLDFVQSTFSRFKYEDCRALFSQAQDALRSSRSTEDTVTPEARLHLFVRLTTMIQEAGYQELALATWQAVLEFSLLAPHDLTGDKVQQFEEFWESEVPRIGEPDSKGWRHTSIEEAMPPPSSITLETSRSPKSSLDEFRRHEIESVNKLRYPGRSTDDVGEDDPFHTIFFSDLKDYVTNLPLVSREMQIDAFLCFCGLPRLARTNPGCSWWADPFSQSRTSHFQSATKTGSENLSYQEALSRYSQSPFAHFQMTSDLLVQQTFSLDPSMLSPDFARNALKLLAMNTPEGELVGEYLLAFEYRYFPSEVAKSAKRLLKDRPSSLRLYNMYGLIEGHLGNPGKADHVFHAALNIQSTSADRLELLSSHIWQALIKDDKVEACWRLVQSQSRSTASRMSRPDSVCIQTTRTALQVSLENALLNKDYLSAVLNTTFLALLAYLSSDCDASAALSMHSNLTAWFASHKLASSVHAEIHAQAIARLLAYHVTHTSIVKPALLRTALEPLIATFPNNTILLSTYAANEARFSIDDRVRGNMRRVLHTSPTASVVTWAFAIHHEILKGEIAGSTSHSIRALYKRATNLDASGAHCPALWNMYLQFELEQLCKEQNLRPNKRPRRDGKKGKWENRIDEAEDKVKETFYQGLKMLPWVKDFVMLAFTAAKDVFGDEELWRLYRVMMEKELRVYTEMDESET
ncbi:DUF1740-domain-containing protein [Macroventuria anomochaeta]|uniref:DUF1740-domain-containing protein n=1 Tax=Macroventuria anomochaeta TaxID=301207 RepID=A0ACB6RHR4_9PLEO|nr:DUF1740-domain-containing protein [Macroventuria anomochaeta]KAF2621431.1 DUF1740-domain-containing protein [Macroventuria anomochaeta]